MATREENWRAFLALPGEQQRAVALDIMAQVVAQAGPDYCYRIPDGHGQCVYVNRGEPSCLIGRVLHALGIPLDQLAQMDVSTQPSIQHRGPAIGLQPETTDALHIAQVAQDDGAPWGQCLIEASDRDNDMVPA